MQAPTIEEQREAIQKYCLSKPKHCETCKIKGPCFHYGGNPTVMSDIGIVTLYKAFIGFLRANPTEYTNADEKPLYDAVTKPQHYASTSIECIDAMEETQGTDAVIDFCVCNAFKYLWRHNQKNGDEDVRKASWYLNKAVELMNQKEVHVAFGAEEE